MLVCSSCQQEPIKARHHDKSRHTTLRSSWNPAGLAVYISFCLVTLLYFYVRYTTTLDLGASKLYALFPGWDATATGSAMQEILPASAASA